MKQPKKRPIKLAITRRTAREWAKGHSLRKLAAVMDDSKIDPRDSVLICSLLGEPRKPPPADDRDIIAACSQCRRAIVHRVSAPPLPKWCWQCVERIRSMV